MTDPALFRNLTNENLVDQYPEKLVDIHSYAKTEIIEFLAPALDSEEDVDARCELLASLREKLCETLCEMFPEYGGRVLYNRRLLHTFANDIYYIGNSIRNNNMDKGLKVVFKPHTIQTGNGDDDVNPDVSLINQSDVIETCLLLRDSVVSLKSVIQGLQQEVTDLKSHIRQLDTKVGAGRATVLVGTQPRDNPVVQDTPTEEEATEQHNDGTQHAEPESTTPNPLVLDTGNTTNNTDNFQLPRSHQKKIQSGDMATPTPRDGIVGTSTAQHSFTGNSRPRKSQMKSIFVGNGSSNTTVTSLRHHLNSIGLSDNVVDIQTVNTKYSDAKSFCVTLSSIDAENKAYNSLWPDRVVVRPYRPPKNKSYNTNNYNYHKNTTPNHNKGNRYHRAQNNSTKKPHNQTSNGQWTQQYRNNPGYNGNVSNVPRAVPSQYMAVPGRLPTTAWSGIYPGYNGQFMPLMSLPNTI